MYMQRSSNQPAFNIFGPPLAGSAQVSNPSGQANSLSFLQREQEKQMAQMYHLQQQQLKKMQQMQQCNKCSNHSSSSNNSSNNKTTAKRAKQENNKKTATTLGANKFGIKHVTTTTKLLQKAVLFNKNI